MSQKRDPSLLVAVIRAVDEENKVKPRHQPNGGEKMRWPFVAAAMQTLEPQGGWSAEAAKCVYKRMVKAKSPDEMNTLAESAATPELLELVRRHMGGEAQDPPADSKVPSPETPISLPEFPVLKDRPALGWSGSYLDAIIAAQEIAAEQDTSQTKVPVIVHEELPYAVTFSGDWHIGGRCVDHKLLREYFDLWKRTRGLGLVGMGDYGEFFTGKMARIGVQEHIMPVDIQVAATVDLIESELNGALIALLKGNHDNWMGNYANFVQSLAERLRKPYLGIGGEILLTVGRTEYRIACWHRYPGAGAVNKGNNQRRASVDHNGPDVVALAHLHEQYGEISNNGEVRQVRCRSGAMKVSDEHSRDAAGNVFADTRMPCVIFHPVRKSMLYFADFREGIEPLLHYRKRWHQRPDWTTDPKWLDHLISVVD